MRLKNDELNISISKKSYEHMIKVSEVKRISDQYPNEKISYIEELVFELGVNLSSFTKEKQSKYLKLVI